MSTQLSLLTHFTNASSYFYRPQRSWGKVIFSQASVILSTGMGACSGGVCLLQGGLLPGRTWWRPPPGTATGMHSCIILWILVISCVPFFLVAFVRILIFSLSRSPWIVSEYQYVRCLSPEYPPAATTLRQGNVFTSICHSVQRAGGSGRHPPLQTPPGQTPPWVDIPLGRHHPGQTSPWQTPTRQTPPKQTATEADGTHPTGMHSCVVTALCSFLLPC